MPARKELEAIFDELKKILETYSPPFSVKTPSEALRNKQSFELTSCKKVVIAGRPKDEVYFAGIIIQKNYVGFYSMLAYAEPEVRSQLSPEFMALLKGKSCFYIKNADRPILNQVKKLLDIGLEEYRAKGWI